MIIVIPNKVIIIIGTITGWMNLATKNRTPATITVPIILTRSY